MDSDGSLLLQIVGLIILIGINAFFAASEIAILQLNEAKLNRLAEEGNKKAIRLVKLTQQPSRFLATIQVGVTFAGFFASAVAASSFTGRIMALFDPASLSATAYSAISTAVLVVITLLLSYFTLVFGELVPKRVAMEKPDGIAMRVAGILNAFSKITRPFVAFLAFSTNGICRLLGINGERQEEQVTEEEIRMLVDVGEERGIIDRAEKHMINNIFEFDERSVEEVMTHRTNITAVSLDTPPEQVVALAVEMGYSRIPVYKDDIDSIEGILYVKDLLPFVGKPLPEDFRLEKIARRPHFVPESNSLSELFSEMSQLKLQMAIVVDEYGGTSGLVTMEDLLEAIVGNIQDEYDEEEEEIEKIGEDTFEIEGTTSLDDVEEMLETKFPEGDYDTLGGLVLDILGRIPSEQEHPAVEVGGYRFLVQEVADNRIVTIIATKLQEAPAEAAAAQQGKEGA